METRGKCCGTCLWCYTEEDLKNDQYNDEELNTIQAGDCIMGMNDLHDTLPYCESYAPLPNLENTYVVYDETYLGPGYIIINEIDGEIQKFMKLYVSNKTGFPFYKIRAYTLDNRVCNKIKFNLSHYINKNLFKIIKELRAKLKNNKIISIDKLNGKNSFLEILVENDAALITLSKESNDKNYIDISIGNHLSSDYYEIINEFYEELSLLATSKDDNFSKTLKIS